MNESDFENSRELLRAETRRHFFKQAGFGIGAGALTSLLNPALFASEAVNPQAAKSPMFPAKAKSVIYLFMAGAPSQVDLLDPKPLLQKYDGQNVPQELTKGERFAFIKGTPKLLGSPYEFKRCGKSGAEISELLPHLQEVADKIAHCAFGAHHAVQPCAGPDLHEHRVSDYRAPQYGIVDDLWPRQRVQRPARLCRAHLRREPARRR